MLSRRMIFDCRIVGCALLSYAVFGALAFGCLSGSPDGSRSNPTLDAMAGTLADADASAPSSPEPFDGALSDISTSISLPCNTWPQLCDRTYDKISFPTTHASMAYATPPWDFPAQRKSILQQLDDSIRALMLEVHDVAGVLTLCLQDCESGSLPLAGQLAQVQQFLAVNPREVVTLIIDNRVDPSRVASALGDAQLMAFLHPQAPGDPWPTLGSLISEGQRLVVFVEDATGAQSTLLPLWSFAWATGPDFHSAGDMTCAPALGNGASPLLLVLNYLTTPDAVADGEGGGAPNLDGGVMDDAADAPVGDLEDSESEATSTDAPLSGHASDTLAPDVNSDPFLINRLEACQLQYSQLPNFVAVDFYDTSDVVTATQILNGLVPANFAEEADGSTK